MNEGIWGRSKWGRTHSYGLKVDISSGDLDGDAWYRMRSGLGEEGGHTSKEVPNILSLTKDIERASSGALKGRWTGVEWWSVEGKVRTWLCLTWPG